MTSVGQQQKNDCVIVAIANANNLSYENVAARLPKPDAKNGLFISQYEPLLKELGWIQQRVIPRRGQDKITGLVRIKYGMRRMGHLVYMKVGIIFDAFHPNGITLAEYKARHYNVHINMLWVKS